MSKLLTKLQSLRPELNTILLARRPLSRRRYSPSWTARLQPASVKS